MAGRDAKNIEREIEQARESLAANLDELAERVSPKRAVRAFLASPRGQAVVGAAAGMLVVGVLLAVRSHRRGNR